MNATVAESEWDLDGFRIAGRRWRTGSGSRPVLALHGWLDNAASFDRLAPLLPDADIVAIDLPGHGLSEHRGPRGTYNIWDDLPELVRLLDRLGWERCHLIGHSRGAVVGSLFAGTLPERITSAAFLDSVWSVSPRGVGFLDQLALFVRDYSAPIAASPRYPSVERALEVRSRVAVINAEVARPIVERGLKRVEGGWQWRADPRLRLASAFKLDRNLSRQLLERLQSVPRLALFAEGGFGRYALAEPDMLALLPHVLLPGGHHFHLEAQAAAIADAITSLWQQVH